MKSLKVLDVTLRDGGCVNNFNFGQDYIEKILAAQESSGVDIIEMGYIDEKDGSISGRTQYVNETVISQHIIKEKKSNILYVAMADYGKYDFNKLTYCSKDSIDGIRLAFHKKNKDDILKTGKQILEKGYQLYIQPMITLRYSDSELLKLIDTINKVLPDISGFYIVDSFGEMRPNDMNRIMNLIDNNLIGSVPLGFHSHNNLQMSYSNAVALLQFPTNRDLIIDSSIMGMGKGAGNLNTELLLEHLNLFYGGNYNISPLLQVIDSVITQLRSEYYWGYAVEYYLSSINHCSPSYASFYYHKFTLPIEKVGELLSKIDEEKKISFDKEYAENLYYDYNAQHSVNDEDVIQNLANKFSNKTILLVGPGKSIINYKEKILSYITKEDVISIGLNLISEFIFDYCLITRKEVYKSALSKNMDDSIIAVSNIYEYENSRVKVLNYKNWVQAGAVTHDSALVIAIGMLKKCCVKNILLAGIDGFSMNINDNYANPGMRRPVNDEQAKERNIYFREYVQKMKDEGISIEFITPSKYID